MPKGPLSPNLKLGIQRYRGDKPAYANPKTDETKAKYFKIYNTYISKHLTIRQVAEKHKMNPDHVSDIIKWCAYYLDKSTDHTVLKNTMESSLSNQLQKLEKIFAKSQKIGKFNDQVSVMAEIRRTLKLLAQVRGVVNGENAANQTNIQVNVPNLNRGSGEAEAIEVEKEEVIETRDGVDGTDGRV